MTDTRSNHERAALLAISKVYDLEEDIWSPTHGIRGKLDATVEAVVSDWCSSRISVEPIITSGPKPFEIKTGRSTGTMEHRAQTMLYALLTAERYGAEVSSGLLYYTQTDEVINVPTSRNELRGLFIVRNEIAEDSMRRSRKMLDMGSCTTDSGLSPTVDGCRTIHLNPTQRSFLDNWESLIAFEEQKLRSFKEELWTMEAKDREGKGRCFSSMVVDSSYPPLPQSPDPQDAKNVYYTYRFIRSGDEEGLPSLLSGHMRRGDAVLLSVDSESHLLALARGIILKLTSQNVVVAVDHVLDLDTIMARRVVFKGASLQAQEDSPQILFRIDKGETSGGLPRLRANLSRLFHIGDHLRQLELIVDLKPPQFVEVDQNVHYINPFSVSLNEIQQLAITKVLAAQDYAIIGAASGTGKTVVISCIIRTLVGMHKTVLLTSSTHSAVDAILLKLRDYADFDILRLGNLDKVRDRIDIDMTMGLV